jgi:hypothetical protein
METYTKKTRGYFNDRADLFEYGVSLFGSSYSTLTPGIVNNPMKWEDRLDGYKNPKWRDQVRAGQGATTTMLAFSQTVASYPMVAFSNVSSQAGDPRNYAVYRWQGYPLYASPSSTTLPAGVQSAVRNRALRKFLDRAIEARNSIQGGQNLGEWKELLHAVTNPLGALREFTLSHLGHTKRRVRGLKKNSKKLTKVLADSYLEFTFGWNPLSADIANALVGLQTRMQSFDRTVVHGSAQQRWEGDVQRNQIFQTYSSCTVYQNVQSYGTYQYRYEAAIRTGAVDGVKSRMQVLGLLPERFFPTLWELIPYSFVSDYFVNIGDIINALAFQRSEIIWGQTTSRDIRVREYTDAMSEFKPTAGFLASYRLNGLSASGGRARIQAKTVERASIDQDSLLPDLEFHLPVSKKPWINMAALLVSRVKA